MGDIERLSILHQRLWVTSSVMIGISLLACAFVWWRAQPIGMGQHVLMRISMLLIASNCMIGVWLALNRPTVVLLHAIYGVIIFAPAIGVRFLTRYSNKSSHAMYYCIALCIMLLILHRLAVTAPH
ncbi:MAG: hypothetical protein ACKO83_05550 [Roseiflexaceae bacterium]